MVAWMNREALDHTIATGRATYFSRSRKKLWKKGEESGHVQTVRRILVDCDQDCLILKVAVDEGQCHVGYQSCFYRALKPGSATELEFIAEKVYDPTAAYKKITYAGSSKSEDRNSKQIQSTKPNDRQRCRSVDGSV